MYPRLFPFFFLSLEILWFSMPENFRSKAYTIFSERETANGRQKEDVRGMKKKYLTMFLAGMGIAAVAALFILSGSKKLGNISRSFSSSEPATNVSTISFSAKRGDDIRFYFSSRIEQGILHITLYDSEGNQVKELDQARELVTYLTIGYDDTFTLAAEYTNFAGKFNVDVSRTR